HRRTSPLLEREQRLRRLQLQRVSLAGELLRISFAGRVLELPQLPQKHFALASEIARFHGMNSAGPRRAPWTSEQTPDEKRAEPDQPVDAPHRRLETHELAVRALEVGEDLLLVVPLGQLLANLGLHVARHGGG